uniref:Ultrahigh sulfur keratin-associated protein n=1 Tax=Anopheles gambiae TaxID=7165 RepID=A0A1S4H6L7_ANOGA
MCDPCCGPCDPCYSCYPCSTPRSPSYLCWWKRPLIVCDGTDTVHYSWNLRRKEPNIPDIRYEEMYDRCGRRIF